MQEITDDAPWVFLWDIHDVHIAKADLKWKARPTSRS